MKPALTRRNPNQKRAIKTKKKLISTALRMLKQDGFSKLTTRRLAKKSGISIGVIYDYFPSKQALIFWIYKERLNRQVQIFEECMLGENLKKPVTESYPEYINTMTRERMWSRLDTEFRLAENDDEDLTALIRDFKNELVNRICIYLKAHGSPWPEQDLMNLAEFSQAIDLAGMKLQMDADTKDSLAFFSRMTGSTTLFLLYQCGAIGAKELDILSEKLNLQPFRPLPPEPPIRA